jgi:hypothetical protein
MKQLLLEENECELITMSIEQLLLSYNEDLKLYKQLLLDKNYEYVTHVRDITIVLTKDILLEEKEFLTIEIMRTEAVLAKIK